VSKPGRNFYAGLAFFLALVVLVAFAASLLGASSGEVAGALGSVIGGAAGALGAAAAVYLTLTLQRDDETLKVHRAIAMEIATLSKFPSGQLDTCVMIYTGEFKARRDRLLTLVSMPVPVVYPSVAGQISRHPQVELIVAFYSMFEEARSTALIVAEATERGPLLDKIDIVGLGTLLREQCRVARDILRADASDAGKSGLSEQILRGVHTMLDISVKRADQIFPSVTDFEKATDPFQRAQ
jgi:hypothetical protein